MNKQVLLKKIGYIISEISEQYQYLSKNPDSLNELELELLIANSHFLSEHISILTKINANEERLSLPLLNPETNHPEEIVPIQLPEEFQQIEKVHVPEISEPAHSDWSFKLESENIDEEKSEVYAENEESPDLKTSSKVNDMDAELSEEEIPFILKRNPIQQIEKPLDSFPETRSKINQVTAVAPKTEIIQEIKKPELNQKIPTINDLLSAHSSQNTIATRFRNHSGNDLKSIISLNDKLLFVKDLFNGYSLAYSEAIELINRFDNLEEADKFLQENYAPKNNWTDKQSTADKFYEVLNKRFS